jgi:hypothetical protein
MPKAIKIDVSGNISEVDDVFKDPEYREMATHDPWALHVPMVWKYKKYCLTMICKGIFEESDRCNFKASFLYHHLYSKNGHPSGPVLGTAWFMNEDNEKELAMTKEDIDYIFKHTILHQAEKEKERLNK